MPMIQAAAVGVPVLPDLSLWRERLRAGLAAEHARVQIPVEADDRGFMRAMARVRTAADNTSRGLRGIGAKGIELLTSRAATLASTLLAVVPAAETMGMAVVAGAGAAAVAVGAAAAAVGAFALAAKPQLTSVTNAADLYTKAQEAAAAGGTKAAAAQKAYTDALAKMPPATRALAVEFIGLKQEFKKWSDALAEDTMPVFAKGVQIARRALPGLTPLVRTGADALWDFLVPVERAVKDGRFAKFTSAVNKIAKQSLPSLLRAAGNVGKGLLGIFEAFMPHAPGMARGIEGLTEKFAKWGQSLKSSDSFRQFMDHVSANLPTINGIFRNLVQIVQNLAPAMLPLSGISLKIVEGFTAILAALPPEVVRALGIAFVTVTTAVRILTPVMAALNIVLDANPVGLVVLALAALVAGLVIAYKKSSTFRDIVNGAWQGIQKVVSVAWHDWIKPALDGLADGIAHAVKWWQDKWPQLKVVLDEVAGFFQGAFLFAINTVADAFGGIGDKASDATKKVAGVGTGFQGVQKDGDGFLSWAGIFGAGIGLVLLGPLGGLAGYITGQFWPQIKTGFTQGFQTLYGKTTEFARWLPGALRRAFTEANGALLSGLKSLWRSLTNGLPPLKLSWSSMWHWWQTFSDNVFKTVGRIFSGAMTGLGHAAERGVQAMRSAFSRLPGGVKTPVNWVINHAYNDGLRRLWNRVMGWLHLPGGLQLHTVPALERGGTLAHPAAAKPMMTNGPMAIVGEGRPAYPEFVIPTDPQYRGRAQALWTAAGGRLQMLAGGGILGGFLDDVKKIAHKIEGVGQAGLDLISNPGKVWDRLARSMVPSSAGLGVDPWGKGVAAVPPKLGSEMRGAALQLVKAFASGYGGDVQGVVKAAASMIGRGDDRGENNNWLTRAWGMPGAPWCAMFVSEAIKKAGASKHYPGYPSAAVASYVGAMRHVGLGDGRPGDLGAYRGTGHINVIAKNLGGGRYETIGGNEGPRVQRGVRSGQSSILRPLARGGVLDGREVLQVFGQRNLDPADDRDPLLQVMRGLSYDDGGYMPPGRGIYDNRTGHPEPVLSSRQWDIAEAALAAAGGGGDTWNIYPRTLDMTPRDVELLQRQRDTRNRMGRPY